MLDRVPDRPLGEREARAELADGREGVDQGLEFRLENGMGHYEIPFSSTVGATDRPVPIVIPAKTGMQWGHDESAQPETRVEAVSNLKPRRRRSVVDARIREHDTA
jgi:hypothetical protein